MSLAFDETGRPYLILREQGKKKRVKGLEAHKVIINNLFATINIFYILSDFWDLKAMRWC